MLNGHGDDLYKYESIRYNFSSNVIYHGTPKPLLEHLRQNLMIVGNYPSPTANELNELAGKYHNITREHFLFTNGATEAFYMIAHLFRGKSARIFTPTFSEYESACISHDIHCTFTNRMNLTDSIEEDLCFICNPNNPDGSLILVECIQKMVESNRACTFVVDEAYIDFSSKCESAIPLLERFDNLLVIRSLTKCFAIPGVRLGYIIAGEALITKLLAIKVVWSVNSLAVTAGVFIFENRELLSFSLRELTDERDEFMRKLKAIDSLEVLDTNTNYFLCKVKKGTASALKEYLCKQGILVRDATNFRGLSGEYIRLSVQSDEANTILLGVLRQWSI